MSYRPLKEHPDNEIWRWLTKKINDALDCVYGFATNILGQKNSITKDEEDKKIQLVNDLSNTELETQHKDLIYGWSKTSKARGWKEDWGGRIGSKEVNEIGIRDNVIPVYHQATGKYELELKPSTNENVGGAYTSSFTIGDWILDRDYYYIVFTHNLNTQPVLVQLWKDKILVFPDSIEIIDNNAIKVKVTADPDNRFYGDILIIKGGDYTGQGPSGGGESLQQLLQPLWYLIY